MIKELLPTEPVDMLQQGDPVVQAPKQDPPYKKKVYDKLVSSFEDFKLSEDDFYKKLVSDKTYAAKVHKVLVDNFEDFTKPSDKFVADITFEEPLKKKDSASGISLQNVQASSQAPQVDVAAGLSTLIPTKSPSASQERSDEKIDLNFDLVTLARKSKKLETGNEDAYSAQLNKLGYKDDFISNIKDLPEGYEKSQYYGTDILANDYQVNPLRFQRKVASLKWQAPLASVIQDSINQVRKTNLPETEKQDKISQLLSDNKRWAYLNESKVMNEIDKQDAFKEKKAFIYKYINDEKTQNKLIDNLRKDSSINFGGETDLEKFKRPEGGNFTTMDYIAMNYLEKTDPSKADFYYRVLFDVDKNEVNKSNLTSNAYNKLKRELSEIGINLVYNNAKEKYDDLVEKGNKNNGILSDSDFEKLEKYGGIVKNSSLEYDNLKNEYGDADDEDLEINAQEAAGQRSNTPSTLAKILFGAFAKSGSSIAKIVKAPFQDEKSSNLDLLEAAGLQDALAESTNLTSDKSIYNSSELRMSPALQARVNTIKSDKSLSQDEIVDKTKELFKQNKDQWERVTIEGKFNITPKSVSTSIVKLFTEIAPYLTLEAASAGTATPSVVSSVLKTLSFVSATSYQDALANAVENKDPNPEKTALVDIAINTVAIEVGGFPSKIRAKLAKSSVGETIAKLSDKEIASFIKPSKLTDYITNSVTKSGKAVVSSLKGTVPMQVAFAAGDILKGADVNSEFAKEQVASLLSFTGLGAITGMIGKDAKRENNTKDAFYLAGKNGDAILEYVDKQVSNGKMSEKNAEAIIENVGKANEVYSKLPEKDANGNPLTERQKSDILYSTIKSQEKQVKAEEAPLAEEQVIETPLAEKTIEKPVEPIIETETIAKPTKFKEAKPIEAKVEAEPTEQKMEVKPTEVKVETEKPSKEVVFTAYGTGDNGYVIEHAQGIEKKDVKRLEDARSVVTEQVGLNNEQKAELENTGSLITENKILENGDKKITVHFKNRDAFGRKGGSRFDLVIPENNASTAEGIKKVVDNFYTENEALGGKTLEGSKYIQEGVKRVQKYLDTNKLESKPEVKPTKEISAQEAEVKFTEAKARYERARGKESKPIVDKLKDEAINAKSELDDIRNKTKVQERAQPELKPIEKEVFKSSQGNAVDIENGKLVVKDKKGEVLSDRASRKAIEEYAENFDYSKGDKAPEVPLEITNSRDAAKYVVEESSNPIEIAEIYASEDLLPKESNAKFQAIAEYGLGRIKTSSYKNLGDPNKIEKSMYLKIFSEERGTPIDVLAKSISDKYEGLNIEPQDIVDYIEKYSKGDKGALEFKESDVALQAADKFNKLTGLDLNSELANKVIDNKLGKANKDQLEIIKQDYETAKQLEDAYWAEYKKTDGFTKESNISKVNKPEPAKEPSKKLEEAYKDLTNIEKRQIINSKFEELLKELKIEKICPTD